MPTRSRPAFSGEFEHDHKIGIIDIGSNSIRLMVYDGLKRVPVPLFNEKVFCGLGRGLGESGTLNPDGVKLAKASFKRLFTMVKLLDVVELQIIATAAVRDATDGPAFMQEIETQFGVPIRIISGEEEARLAGYGVMSTIHAPRGVAGDLGGGSMELVHITSGGLGQQHTMPIGPLRLIDQFSDVEKARQHVKEQFAPLEWVPQPKGANFYAVGGSFRALARIHQALNDYPLGMVQHYKITAAQARSLCERVHHMPAKEMDSMRVRNKRIPSMPYAAMVLEEILAASCASHVVFCASGIREGHLYHQLSPYLRKEDPLIASCTDLSIHEGLRTPYAKELFAWMEPLFMQETAAKRRLRQAACILTEIAWHMHTDYRAMYAFERMLYSAIVGLNHEERTALALALFCRYKYKHMPEHPMLAHLPKRMVAWARSVGVAANLAFQISGGMPGNLPQSHLEIGKKGIKLHTTPALKSALNDGVKKRLALLASLRPEA